MLQIENMIVHPSYNSSTNTHLGDLAILKLEPRTDLGSVQWGNYTAPACLPSLSPEQDQCQVAGWAVTTQGKGSLRSAVLAHEAVMQHTRHCLQGQGSLIDPAVEQDDIICSTVRCNRFVSGPMFCRASNSGNVHNVHCSDMQAQLCREA